MVVITLLSFFSSSLFSDADNTADGYEWCTDASDSSNDNGGNCNESCTRVNYDDWLYDSIHSIDFLPPDQTIQLIVATTMVVPVIEYVPQAHPSVLSQSFDDNSESKMVPVQAIMVVPFHRMGHYFFWYVFNDED